MKTYKSEAWEKENKVLASQFTEKKGHSSTFSWIFSISNFTKRFTGKLIYTRLFHVVKLDQIPGNDQNIEQ